MDLAVLKKKVSTYRTEGGYVKNISDELLMEVLVAWEGWTGPASGFYSAIGVNQKRMGSLIGRAKKLKRDGFPTDGFKEIKIAESISAAPLGVCAGVEIVWEGGRVIRFREVTQLVDFLKATSQKVA